MREKFYESIKSSKYKKNVESYRQKKKYELIEELEKGIKGYKLGKESEYSPKELIKEMYDVLSKSVSKAFYRFVKELNLEKIFPKTPKPRIKKFKKYGKEWLAYASIKKNRINFNYEHVLDYLENPEVLEASAIHEMVHLVRSKLEMMYPGKFSPVRKLPMEEALAKLTEAVLSKWGERELISYIEEMGWRKRDKLKDLPFKLYLARREWLDTKKIVDEYIKKCRNAALKGNREEVERLKKVIKALSGKERRIHMKYWGLKGKIEKIYREWEGYINGLYAALGMRKLGMSEEEMKRWVERLIKAEYKAISPYLKKFAKEGRRFLRKREKKISRRFMITLIPIILLTFLFTFRKQTPMFIISPKKIFFPIFVVILLLYLIKKVS